MPTRTDEDLTSQHDRERQPGSSTQHEPRDFESSLHDAERNDDAPFDAGLSPNADEDINTDGSER